MSAARVYLLGVDRPDIRPILDPSGAPEWRHKMWLLDQLGHRIGSIEADLHDDKLSWFCYIDGGAVPARMFAQLWEVIDHLAREIPAPTPPPPPEPEEENPFADELAARYLLPARVMAGIRAAGVTDETTFLALTEADIMGRPNAGRSTWRRIAAAQKDMQTRLRGEPGSVQFFNVLNGLYKQIDKCNEQIKQMLVDYEKQL